MDVREIAAEQLSRHFAAYGKVFVDGTVLGYACFQARGSAHGWLVVVDMDTETLIELLTDTMRDVSLLPSPVASAHV